MSTCSVWWSLATDDRKKLVMCEFHPFQETHSTSNCFSKKAKYPCQFCKSTNHHFLFCTTHKSKGFLTRLQTFTVKDPIENLSKGSVLLPFKWVPAGANKFNLVRCGTLIDSCSSDDFLTHDTAARMGLKGRSINLITEGFGGKKTHVPEAKLYDVVIQKANGECEKVCFYGVNKIGNAEAPISRYQFSKLCEAFGVTEADVERPHTIEMLIGQRNNHLFPKRIN